MMQKSAAFTKNFRVKSATFITICKKIYSEPFRTKDVIYLAPMYGRWTNKTRTLKI
jgi:hypothetical protein